MKPNHLFIRLLAVLFAFPLLGTFAQQAPISIEVLTTFDYPGDVNSTVPQKINDAGEITGDFFDSSGTERGFIRFRDGTFSDPIVFPGSTGTVTQARGINNLGVVCGFYVSDNVAHSYFLSSGTYTQFDATGATNTYVNALNDASDFTGTIDTTAQPGQGFASIGGSMVTFTIPGGLVTTAYGINNSDQIAGSYFTGGTVYHGFFRDTDGTLTFPIDPAGSTATFLFGNNDKDMMVGRYVDGTGVAHGFLLKMPNRFVTFDYPGATFTSLNGINRQGYICGRYTDSSGITHGLVARARRGSASDNPRLGINSQSSSELRGKVPPE